MMHVPRCTCFECLPGWPAHVTRVTVDKRPLWRRALERRQKARRRR